MAMCHVKYLAQNTHWTFSKFVRAIFNISRHYNCSGWKLLKMYLRENGNWPFQIVSFKMQLIIHFNQNHKSYFLKTEVWCYFFMWKQVFLKMTMCPMRFLAQRTINPWLLSRSLEFHFRNWDIVIFLQGEKWMETDIW